MGTPPIEMANLGMADSLILMVMALVVFGPRRLPQIGRQIGKLMYEFRKASNDFKFQMEEELRSAEDADRRKADEERMKALAVTAIAPKLGSPQPEAVTTLEGTVPPAVAEDAAGHDTDSGNVTHENAAPGDAGSDASGYPTGNAVPAEPAPVENTPRNTPRIQPPSTGEPVASSRPSSFSSAATVALGHGAEASAEPAAEANIAADESPAQPAAANAPSAPEPEQAAHHG
jgi:sec-independent protein translocase protein TatB